MSCGKGKARRLRLSRLTGWHIAGTSQCSENESRIILRLKRGSGGDEIILITSESQENGVAKRFSWGK